MPVPTLMSEPPVPPDAPPSAMTPLTSVDKPLPPTVSRLEPRKKVPAPAIEPAVIPVVVKPDMSITPPVLMVNCAWPPVLWSVKITKAWSCGPLIEGQAAVRTVAFSAEAKS